MKSYTDTKIRKETKRQTERNTKGQAERQRSRSIGTERELDRHGHGQREIHY